MVLITTTSFLNVFLLIYQLSELLFNKDHSSHSLEACQLNPKKTVFGQNIKTISFPPKDDLAID